MSYRLDRLKDISPVDRGRFEADGFLIVERLLEPEHPKLAQPISAPVRRQIRYRRLPG
jgi:hypothetical protein